MQITQKGIHFKLVWTVHKPRGNRMQPRLKACLCYSFIPQVKFKWEPASKARKTPKRQN